MAITRLTIYTAGAAVGVLAWVLNLTQLYWMACVFFLLPRASRLLGRLEHCGVTVEREIPSAGHQGERVPVRLRVASTFPLPKLHLQVRDALPDGLRAEPGEPLPVALPPRGSDTAEYQLLLRRRGAWEIPAALLTSEDLLGLHVVETRVPVRSELLVYPRRVDLPYHVLPHRIGGGQAPLEMTPRKGDGSSFFGTREYRPGDPLRHVHWRASARLGRLAVVEWEAEESAEILLAIETSRGSERDLGPGTTLDLAAGLAASLAAHVLAQGDSVKLLAPDRAEAQPALYRGLEALPDLLERLARMSATADIGLPHVVRQVPGHVSVGAVVCLLTPLPGPELVEAARFLQEARLQPVVYALLDADPDRDAAWEAVASELASRWLPTICLRPEEDWVRRLLG